MTGPGRPRQFSLDDVVDAALALIEEHGTKALTMQSLAKRLGTGGATLYNYVGSRDELIDLVLGRALAELPHIPRLDRDTWGSVLVDYLVASFRQGVARPAVAHLWHQRPTLHLGAAARLQEELAVLASLGFSPDRAAEIYRILGAQLYGHLSLATSLAHRPATALAVPGSRLSDAQQHLMRLDEERIYASAVKALVASLVVELESALAVSA